MSFRNPLIIAASLLLLWALGYGALRGYSALNEHLRIRDATPAFQPIEHLRCRILSQPVGTRYCRYLVIFPAESALSDANMSELESLNLLPPKNTLDVVIETPAVSDESLAQLTSIHTFDLLDVTKSSISDEGIESLRRTMPHAQVNTRRTTR